MIVRSDKTTPGLDDVDLSKPIEVSDDVDLSEPSESHSVEETADSTEKDEWCCCDETKVPDEEKLVCLTPDGGHRTLLEVEPTKKPTDGYSIPVEETTKQTCVGEKMQPCTTDCETTTYLTFKQRSYTGTFDRSYELPVTAWNAAKYSSKYYSEEKQNRKHAINTDSGNIYAEVEDAKLGKYGIKVKKDTKYCTKYETFAYWKEGLHKSLAWKCVQEKKCVQYVNFEDPCGGMVRNGEGVDNLPVEDLKDTVGGDLYKVQGRKGQCQKAEVKTAWYDRTWKKAKNIAGDVTDSLGKLSKYGYDAGAGSECPSKMFHSSTGMEWKGKAVTGRYRPGSPYRFCDCSGECK